MRLATIDIGTNTAQLLVVEGEGTTLRRLHAAERFVRLGEGVDRSGRIGRAAQGRLLDTLREHKQTAEEHGATTIVVAGTSALRDATNRQAVLDRIQDDLGLSVEVLSGDEEALWSFAAACSAFDDLTGPCLVVDVGGGYTELIVGMDPSQYEPTYVGAMTDRVSLDVGCVRLTERCFSSQPPSAEEVDRVEHLIDMTLDNTALSVDSTPILIGTAGTATALALVHSGPDSTWDALHGGGFVLTQNDVRRWRKRLLELRVDAIRALHPEAMEGRADVFPVGVILLDRILAHYGLESLRVSPYELRHGLALRALSAE
jgi:exopolyphosphatase/guanosine-5'-triphosphate,3'-diphosphate pyrophosphatase